MSPISSRQRRMASTHVRDSGARLRSEMVAGSPPFRRTTTSARSRRVSASSGTWSATSSSARSRRASCASTPYDAKTRASIDERIGSRTRSRHEKCRSCPAASRALHSPPRRPHRAAGRVAPKMDLDRRRLREHAEAEDVVRAPTRGENERSLACRSRAPRRPRARTSSPKRTLPAKGRGWQADLRRLLPACHDSIGRAFARFAASALAPACLRRGRVHAGQRAAARRRVRAARRAQRSIEPSALRRSRPPVPTRSRRAAATPSAPRTPAASRARSRSRPARSATSTAPTASRTSSSGSPVSTTAALTTTCASCSTATRTRRATWARLPSVATCSRASATVAAASCRSASRGRPTCRTAFAAT